MRDAYHEELDSISDSLVEMARLVGSAIGRATTAMLAADLKVAESVIAADEKVDDLQRGLETRAIQLLARQQPVATDLRIVVTSLRMSADLERSGDLAQHVAKVARLLWEGRGYAGVEFCFVSLAEPSVPAALEKVRKLGADRDVKDGRLTARLPPYSYQMIRLAFA